VEEELMRKSRDFEGATIVNRQSSIVNRLWHIYRFIRFSALGATAILPLLGAASVAPRIEPALLLGLLAAALLFHCFAYVLNDVIDLPIDRLEPQRATFPLVRGMVSPAQALAFALAQVPLAFALTAWLGGGPAAFGALALAFALMAVYNLWGKRAPFPPLTDLAQGLGWAALLVYGAALAGPPAPLTAALAAFEVVFILLINGVHGPLRDLANDLRCGARTTAILLGARPLPPDEGRRTKDEGPTTDARELTTKAQRHEDRTVGSRIEPTQSGASARICAPSASSAFPSPTSADERRRTEDEGRRTSARELTAVAERGGLPPHISPTNIDIPVRLTAYAVALHGLLVGLLALPLALNWLALAPLARAATAALALGLALWALALLLRARGSPDQRTLLSAGMAHLVLTMTALIALFALYLDGLALAALLAAHLTPLLPNALSYRTLAWIWRRS
jgi:4-hydroxybenzoate polyprenyltransferase